VAPDAFYPLYWKINIDRLLTYWYCSKATSYLFSTGYVAIPANGASRTPAIIFYCNYNGIRNITGALIKIINYAKSVIEQARRHFEKTSGLKNNGYFHPSFSAFLSIFNLLRKPTYAISGKKTI
jgi:hypothetical protein